MALTAKPPTPNYIEHGESLYYSAKIWGDHSEKRENRNYEPLEKPRWTKEYREDTKSSSIRLE
jgi:hypothetical protein